MEIDVAIDALAALSHERRMSVFHLLLEHGKDGLNAGTIASRLKVPPSSLSFHLTQLEQSGLVASRRFKRQIIYSVVPNDFADLIAFLIEKGKLIDPGISEKVSERLMPCD